MDCRLYCGACCIAPSISSTIPGIPHGKPAGVPCIHLDEAYRCSIYTSPERPVVCRKLQASHAMCGNSRDQALAYLSHLENATEPD